MCVYYDSKISRYQQYYCNSVKGTTLLPSERQIHVRQKKNLVHLFSTVFIFLNSIFCCSHVPDCDIGRWSVTHRSGQHEDISHIIWVGNSKTNKLRHYVIFGTISQFVAFILSLKFLYESVALDQSVRCQLSKVMINNKVSSLSEACFNTFFVSASPGLKYDIFQSCLLKCEGMDIWWKQKLFQMSMTILWYL